QCRPAPASEAPRQCRTRRSRPCNQWLGRSRRSTAIARIGARSDGSSPWRERVCDRRDDMHGPIEPGALEPIAQRARIAHDDHIAALLASATGGAEQYTEAGVVTRVDAVEIDDQSVVTAVAVLDVVDGALQRAMQLRDRRQVDLAAETE